MGKDKLFCHCTPVLDTMNENWMKGHLFMNKKIIKKFITAILIMFIAFMVPASSYAYLGDRTLTIGMQGYDVNQLQRDLNYLGYSAGWADSIFGQQTLAAVKGFQKDHGLKADGIVGKNTANAIIRRVSDGSANPAVNTQGNGSVIAASPSRGSFSNQEIYDLARLVHGEARGEPYVGQVAVAAVVLNRVDSNKFANTIRGVIFEPRAFTAVSDSQFYLTPNQTAIQAARNAIQGWDPTGGALYYWNPQTATSKWVWNRSIITQIGRHVFAR
jgi:N-acetylmuramoyl-L-alanine amidase